MDAVKWALPWGRWLVSSEMTEQTEKYCYHKKTVARSLPMKSRKRSARDVISTTAAHM